MVQRLIGWCDWRWWARPSITLSRSLWMWRHVHCHPRSGAPPAAAAAPTTALRLCSARPRKHAGRRTHTVMMMLSRLRSLQWQLLFPHQQCRLMVPGYRRRRMRSPRSGQLAEMTPNQLKRHISFLTPWMLLCSRSVLPLFLRLHSQESHEVKNSQATSIRKCKDCTLRSFSSFSVLCPFKDGSYES